MPCAVLGRLSCGRSRGCQSTVSTFVIRRFSGPSAIIDADDSVERQSEKPRRWEVQRKFVQPPTANGAALSRWGHSALEHFDQLYGAEFGPDIWPSVRLALLSPPKHVAVFNRFRTDHESIERRLLSVGAEDLVPNWRHRLSLAVAGSNASLSVEAKSEATMDPHRHLSELKVLNYDYREVPVIGGGPAASSRSNLDEFIPATEFITEMDPRGRASPTVRRLGVEIAPDHSDMLADPADPDLWLPCDVRQPPPSFRVFAFPPGELPSSARFPRPKPDPATGLCPYLPLDLGSVAVALALSPADGDSVLDMCAAPGAKAFCLLQCALPSRLLCLEKSPARSGRLSRLLASHVPPAILSACSISYQLGNALDRALYPASAFDCVLIDPTCSGDRHSLNDPSSDLFSGKRSRERIGLPASQLELLLAGAEACRLGGSLVYSTCTLSPAQNEAVVLAALRKLNGSFKLVNLEPLAALLSGDTAAERCRVQVRPAGLLVMPYLLSNYGPTYVCKLRRVK